jgi:hypothetical protein
MTRRRAPGVPTALLACAALALASPARADLLMVMPSDEGSRTLSGSPATPTLLHGPLPMLAVRVDGRDGTSTDSIVEFNIAELPNVPRGALIRSATLSLDVAGAQAVGGPAALTVGGYADGDGLVGLGDFVKPTALVGTTGSLPDGAPGTQDTPFRFDVTSFLQSIVDNKAPFVGFHMVSPSNDSNAWVWGSAAPDPAERPQLSVTFTAVPEPSAFVLGGLGLGLTALALAARGRGRRGGPGGLPPHVFGRAVGAGVGRPPGRPSQVDRSSRA